MLIDQLIHWLISLYIDWSVDHLTFIGAELKNNGPGSQINPAWIEYYEKGPDRVNAASVMFTSSPTKSQFVYTHVELATYAQYTWAGKGRLTSWGKQVG